MQNLKDQVEVALERIRTGLRVDGERTTAPSR